MKKLIALLYFISLYFLPYKCLAQDECAFRPIQSRVYLFGLGAQYSNQRFFPIVSISTYLGNSPVKANWLEIGLGAFSTSNKEQALGATKEISQTDLWGNINYSFLNYGLFNSNIYYDLGATWNIHLNYKTTKNPDFISNSPNLYTNSMTNFIGIAHQFVYTFKFNAKLRAKLYTGYQFKTVREQIGDGDSKVIERDNEFQWIAPKFGLDFCVAIR